MLPCGQGIRNAFLWRGQVLNVHSSTLHAGWSHFLLPIHTHTQVLKCLLWVFWMPVENNKLAFSVLGSIFLMAIAVFPNYKYNVLFVKLLFICWASQRLKCRDFHYSMFFMYVAGRSQNGYILC